jgi:hypothetical protein
MNDLPNVHSCLTYYTPNKKLLKEWLWKTFKASFCKDHSIRGDNYTFVGFWSKAGTNYYASMISPNGRR